jgi:hypothetical protein
MLQKINFISTQAQALVPGFWRMKCAVWDFTVASNSLLEAAGLKAPTHFLRNFLFSV